ncbi:MAG: hypothetical protein HQL52_16270 [Magnetococcales bacterium]|nr:hypothetical protein [Magnetococcales bacterium]
MMNSGIKQTDPNPHQQKTRYLAGWGGKLLLAGSLAVVLALSPDSAQASCGSEADAAEAAYERAEALLERNRFAEADAAYEEAIAAYISAAQACHWRSGLQAELNEKADELSQKRAENQCQMGYFVTSKQKEKTARLRMEAGEWPEARTSYEALAQHFDGIAQNCAGDPGEKAEWYARIARENRNQAWCMERMVKNGVGDVSYRQGSQMAREGDWEGAVPAFQSALAANQWALDYCQSDRIRQAAWFNVQSSSQKLDAALPERALKRCRDATTAAVSIPSADMVERHVMEDAWWERAEPILQRQAVLYGEAHAQCQDQPGATTLKQMQTTAISRLNRWGCQTWTNRAHRLNTEGHQAAAAGEHKRAAAAFLQLPGIHTNALSYCQASADGGESQFAHGQMLDQIASSSCQAVLDRADWDLGRGEGFAKQQAWQSAGEKYQLAVSGFEVAQKMCPEGTFDGDREGLTVGATCGQKWAGAMVWTIDLARGVLAGDRARQTAIEAWSGVVDHCQPELARRATTHIETLKSGQTPQLEAAL